MSTTLNKLKKILQEQKETRSTELTLKDLPSPSKMLNLEDAAQFIFNQLSENKKMLIIGDYDADGVMATTILIRFFKEIGLYPMLVDYIVPDRFKDGYGISKGLIDYAKENGFDFIVTVDNGIGANEAIEYANSLNIPVVITDHHTPPEVLPNATYIVNPLQKEDSFPYPYISGATVAWYLVAQLRKLFNAQIDIRKYLDFLAITVISDVMPLNNINLAIYKAGIKQIKSLKRKIYKLVWNDWTSPTIDETSLGFDFIPMINAVGRIDNANKAVRLFISDKEREIIELYEEMVRINEKRKALVEKQYKEALAKAVFTDKLVIVKDENFHEGIVGIIAGKLAEQFARPAYAFGFNKEKEIWKGSARTSGNVHLYELTKKAKGILGFGGHKGAVGVAIEKDNWDLFQNSLIELAKELKEEDLKPLGSEPLSISLDEVNQVGDLLEEYKPFGHSNPSPNFKVEGVKIDIERELKNGKHFKCNIKSVTNRVPGLFFNVNKNQFLKQIRDINNIKVDISRAYNKKEDSFTYELLAKIENEV